MPKPNVVQSTENLLDIIRGKKSVPAGQGTEKVRPVEPGLRALRPSSKAGVVVGVDLGPTTLRLAMIKVQGGNRLSLLDVKTVDLGTPPAQDLALINLLKAQIGAFCRAYAKTDIWVSMPSKDVEIEHIRLPKAAAKTPAQTAQSVYWDLQRRKKFDANTTLYDFEVLGEVDDKGTPKLELTAWTIPHDTVRKVRRLFNQAGVSLTGVTIVPFCLQNILRTGWISGHERVAHVFIGSDWSRIDIYASGNLAFTREIKTGTNSMIETLAEYMENLHNQPEQHGATGWNGLNELAAHPQLEDEDLQTEPGRTRGETGLKNGFQAARDLLLSRSMNGSRDGVHPDIKVIDVINPAVTRLIRQIERTFEFFSQTTSQAAVEKVYLAGPLCTYGKLVAEIDRQLGGNLEILDPLPPDTNRDGILALPAGLDERAALAPAVGLALSDNAWTPNFIFTHREKALSQQENRTHWAIVASCSAVVLICLALFGWKFAQTEFIHRQIRNAKAQVSAVSENLSRLESRLKALTDESYGQEIENLRQSMLTKNTRLQDYARRHVPLAVIGDIIRLSPESIRLHRIFTYMADPSALPLDRQVTNIRYESTLGQPSRNIILADPFGTYQVEFPSAEEEIPSLSQFVILDGIVRSDDEDLKLLLYKYRAALDTSGLFNVRNVARFDQIYPGLGNVLRFNILLEILT
ncbi:MAG: hypothetical protein EOM25_11255 [Deltaproteobacteria bacterium]|nr:hypothetical protein [Deltaproteobacteria bacterium]